MKRLIPLVFLLAAGCTHLGTRMNSLSVGMSKQQVLEIMGTPDHTEAAAKTESLVYIDRNHWFEHYFVTLENGKVTEFGEMRGRGNATVQPIIQMPIRPFQPIPLK